MKFLGFGTAQPSMLNLLPHLRKKSVKLKDPRRIRYFEENNHTKVTNPKSFLFKTHQQADQQAHHFDKDIYRSAFVSKGYIIMDQMNNSSQEIGVIKLFIKEIIFCFVSPVSPRDSSLREQRRKGLYIMKTMDLQ